MLKTLLKKQLLESTAFIFLDKRSNKKRSVLGLLGYLALFTYVFVVFFGLFFALCDSICLPFASLNLQWLYFSMMGLISVTLGVVGSIFNTYSSLYEAKDNELLLALPIPATYILLIRLISIWLWGFIYMALVYVPAIVVYSLQIGFKFGLFASQLLTLFSLSLFVLALSCILGYGVARISRKIRNKTMAILILSITFLGLYFYGYSQAYQVIQVLVANAITIGVTIQKNAYPIYALGNGALGSLSSLLAVVMICVLFIGVTYSILSKSFFSLAIDKGPGLKKIEYKKDTLKTSSVSNALFHKELKKYLSSANYMLNCSISSIFLIIGAVLLILKMDVVREIFSEFEVLLGKDLMILLLVAATASLGGMNDITAPSISLEGKNFWITKSLPIDTWKIFEAKIKLHLVMTNIPLFIFTLAMIFVVSPGIFESICILLASQFFILVLALLGLIINLWMPNLHWSSEVHVVKQGLGVFIAIFLGWIIILALGFIYYLISDWISPMTYLVIVVVVLVLSSIGLIYWLKTKGKEIYAKID